MESTHQVADFGPGPVDVTYGYPCEGTLAECEQWIEKNREPNDRDDRYAIQEIPA